MTTQAHSNKQRITKITRREVEAHEATGYVWGAGIVPRDETLRALGVYGISGEIAEAIINDAVDAMGHFRMDENYREKRLTPAEMAKQARETAAVAAELEKRIRCMDALVRAHVVEMAFSAWGDMAFPESMQSPLTRLQGLMGHVAAKFDKFPAKVPKRTGPRNTLLAQVVGIIKQHVPNITKAKQREIAAQLLTTWGAPPPANDFKIRKAIKGRGTK